ncbi:MAG: hypothetical protein LBP98_09435 [Tannerella sp.]|jgi:hypothetical protein|nr:hypothetical protein [Tannerella sp.]
MPQRKENEVVLAEGMHRFILLSLFSFLYFPFPLRGWLIVLLTLPAAGLRGQENDRRWALRWSADPLDKPVLTQRSPGASTGNGSSAFALTGEYYLRDNLSVQTGYFRTDVSYGNAVRRMEGAHAGARRYFLHPGFVIRPYLSAAVELNWGEHTQHRTFGGSEGGGRQSYTGGQHTVNPRVSFVPGAGLEFYLLSSVAFTVEYGFHAGLASHTEVNVAYDGRPPLVMRDRGMYHSLSIGVKLDFPFSFTSDDGMSLLNLLMGLLFDYPYETY